jgi:hypothetical protein
MALQDLENSGSSSNPQFGLDASDYQGFGSGGNITGVDFSNSSMLGAGALGVGALGFGAMLAQGPGSLPPQFGQLQGGVPGMRSEAALLEGQGQTLVGQGTQALDMARRGELTPEQQAQLKQYSTGLTNQSRQMFYNMGRNPDADTAAITQTANVDAQVNAMAQQQIQTTIQLGLGEISAGSSLSGQGLGFESAANQALLASGEAQLKMDQQYSSNLTAAFTAIGTMFAKAAIA